jgi:hypothetical protein
LIPATKKLKHLIHSSEPTNHASYLNVIGKYGGPDDAVELFRLFMEDPQDYNRIQLLEPIRKHGDLQLAQVIYDNCFYEQNLRDDMTSEILYVLGYLGYAKCTETLMSLMNADNWHIATQDIRTFQNGIHSKQDLFYRIDVLFEMLECKLTFNDQPLRFTLMNEESVFDIYQAVFESSDDDADDSIIGIIANSLGEEMDLLSKYAHLKEKFEMKLEHRIELDHLAGH